MIREAEVKIDNSGAVRMGINIRIQRSKPSNLDKKLGLMEPGAN